MKMFDVYPRYEIEPVKGSGCYIWDKNGTKYLDLYGGHAVISIGHSHPTYVQELTTQLNHLGFYSNSVKMPIQEELANQLGQVSGYNQHDLFLCNSGAEAIENALKLASFHTGRKKVIVFDGGFHGRTSLAVEASDSSRIQAEINHSGNVIRLPFNDEKALEDAMDETVAAVLVEGIQGISGINIPTASFLSKIRALCNDFGCLFIADEIQSGYGRTGKFFAHQHADVKADIITMAKGMGNGFPIGGILIEPRIEPWPGMLGSTFGGNHLACAAGLAVLKVTKGENLIDNAFKVGQWMLDGLKGIEKVKQVRGKGLMIGLDLDQPIKEIREKLLFDHHIFTGSSSNPNTLRILPPLSLKEEEAQNFISSFKKVLS